MKPNALIGKERTVTACFKEPPEGMAEEAWRVLDEAVGHLALFPRAVREWREDAVAREKQRVAPHGLEECGCTLSARSGYPAPPPAAPLPTTVPPPPPFKKCLLDWNGLEWGDEYLVMKRGDHVAELAPPAGVNGEGWMFGMNLTLDSVGWYPPSYLR